MSDEEFKMVTNDQALTECGVNRHPQDDAMLACKDPIELTAELAKEIHEAISKRYLEVETRFPALVEACPPEMKLAVVAWAMKHIYEHAHEGGTYRYLIYKRLGFTEEAYIPLCTHGLLISNEYDMTKKIN
jgi:hypothetical protein